MDYPPDYGKNKGPGQLVDPVWNFRAGFSGLSLGPSEAMHELDSWREEKRSAYLYRAVADAESGTPRQILFLELAQAAERQAALWEGEVRKLGGALPARFMPDRRTRMVARLVAWLGPRRLRPVLAAMKVRGMSLYEQALPVHGMPASVAEIGRRHQGIGGNNLR